VAGWVSECAGALLEEGRRRGNGEGGAGDGDTGGGAGEKGGRPAGGRRWPDRWTPPVGEREREERGGAGGPAGLKALDRPRVGLGWLG
jgi:hypothetical protein